MNTFTLITRIKSPHLTWGLGKVWKTEKIQYSTTDRIQFIITKNDNK